MAAPFEVSNPYHSQGIAAGGSALLDAVFKGKVHLAKFILDAGEDDVVNTQDFKGKTPLIRACSIKEEKTRAKMLDLLLSRGANINQQDDSGRTVLSYACEMRCNDLITILVQNNIDPDIPDIKGSTALIYSAMSGNDTAIEILVRSFRRLGLHVDHVNCDGMTALLIAAKSGFIECASILALEGRASVTFRDKEKGYNAEDWARAYGCSNQQVLVLSPSMALLHNKITSTSDEAENSLGNIRYLRGRRSFHATTSKVNEFELLDDLDELSLSSADSLVPEKRLHKRSSLPSVSFSSLRDCSSASSSPVSRRQSRSSLWIPPRSNRSALSASPSYMDGRRVNTGTQTDIIQLSMFNSDPDRPKSADGESLRVRYGANSRVRINGNANGLVLCENCQATMLHANRRRSQVSTASTAGTVSGIKLELSSDDEDTDYVQ